ncbi:hypothetical protein PanWU01x14_020040 [Parasponia andersonii]|uniref:Uncharacterized protein n=1 Tax=Parasponia andersonii TaxID=3476 RepID=A0A2P5DYM4_PARAD|nr:hypothetical protein PanWU01x14_020040 [Parasponia andersonii]
MDGGLLFRATSWVSHTCCNVLMMKANDRSEGLERSSWRNLKVVVAKSEKGDMSDAKSQAGSERRGWPPAKTLRCLSQWSFFDSETEYLFPQDFFQRSRAEITVISPVPLYPGFRHLQWLESVRGEIWTNRRLSGRLAPCAHLLRIALNALSGSGGVSYFPLYSGGRPLGLPISQLSRDFCSFDRIRNNGLESTSGIAPYHAKGRRLRRLLNANEVMIPMGLSALSALYNLHIDLEAICRWRSMVLPLGEWRALPNSLTSAEENRFEPHLSAGWLKGLEGIVIFGSPGDCRHIQAALNSQVTTSSQLAGSNDLVVPTSHELEEAVMFVVEECVRLRREEAAAPKRARGSETGPSADPSPVKGGAAGHKARHKAPAGRHLVVPSEDKALAVPRSDAGGPPSRGTLATRAIYGEGMPLSLPGRSASPTSSTPDSGSKLGATCLGRENVELSGGALRLKSRLSSPPPRRRGLGRASSDSDDDGATLTLLRRRRSVSSGPSRGDTPPPTVADGALSVAQLSSAPTATASGAFLAGGEGALMVGRAEPRSAGTGNTQREGSAAEQDQEALSLENVELVASRTFAQLAAIRSFYTSYIRDLTEELNSRSALAERSEAILADVKRTRCEELAARLAKAEANKLAQSEATRLAQKELRVKEQELQSARAEMGLVFIARDRAIDDAKEARKAKLEAHSL